MSNLSHMPFLFNHNDNKYLLYCEKEKDLSMLIGFENPNSDTPFPLYTNFIGWAVHIKNLDTGEVKKIPTPESDLDCNPSIFFENGKMLLSYIASNIITHPYSDGDRMQCLKTSLRTIELNEDFSPKLETESVVQDQTWTGIVTDKYVIYRNNESVAGPCSFTVINKDTKEQKTLSAKNQRMTYRTNPIWGESDKFILTFDMEVAEDYKNASIVIDLNTTQQQLIIRTNDPEMPDGNLDIYKCSILDDKLIYSKKNKYKAGEESGCELIESKYQLVQNNLLKLEYV